MDNVSYKEIEQARKILGLEEEATLKEIRGLYRKLSLKYHPDRCKGDKKMRCKEEFQKINSAYEIIIDYCAGYRYSFRSEELGENSPDNEYRKHMDRFYDDWFVDPK